MSMVRVRHHGVRDGAFSGEKYATIPLIGGDIDICVAAHTVRGIYVEGTEAGTSGKRPKKWVGVRFTHTDQSTEAYAVLEAYVQKVVMGWMPYSTKQPTG